MTARSFKAHGPSVKHYALRQVSPDSLTIKRRRCGRGFIYFDADGKRVTDPGELRRIRSLAIPPAYKDVRIAKQPDAHLQAVGRDDAGRIQYRYHPGWEDVREDRKVEHLAALCDALPRIRRKIARDLRVQGLPRNRVLAAVIALIDRTHIRIGCEDYLHSGRSRGAATLRKRNVRCDENRVHLVFTGKGGREIECDLRSPALARVIGELFRLPGQRLFQYRDEEGKCHRIRAADVNGYLQEIADTPITVKDFRTLAATAAAAEQLAPVEPASSRTGRRKQITAVVKEVADMLGNTPTVARKSYVHRRLIDSFTGGRLNGALRCRIRGLSRGEAAVAMLFK